MVIFGAVLVLAGHRLQNSLRDTVLCGERLLVPASRPVQDMRRIHKMRCVPGALNDTVRHHRQQQNTTARV